MGIPLRFEQVGVFGDQLRVFVVDVADTERIGLEVVQQQRGRVRTVGPGRPPASGGLEAGPGGAFR